MIEQRIVKYKKGNVVYERYLFFNKCDQNENENFSDYQKKVITIAENCDFNHVDSKIMIRDRLIFGMKNKNLSKKYVKDNEGLTLEKVINEALIDENTEEKFNEMSQVKLEEETVNKIQINFSKRLCKFCGEWHTFEKGTCPAFGKKCELCYKMNHNKKVCFQNKKPERFIKNNKYSHKKVKNIQVIESDQESDSDVQICKITDNSSKGGHVKAELMLKFGDKWSYIACDLDTGANACLIGYDFLCEMLENNNPTLEKSQIKLKSFTNTPITVKGVINIPCKRKKKKFSIKFHVVDVNHGPLLSASACTKLSLVKFCEMVKSSSLDTKDVETISKHQLEEAKDIIKKYNSVFEGLGLFEGEVDLEVDESVKPSIQKSRRFPMPKRKKLKEELDKMEKDGIIERERENILIG